MDWTAFLSAAGGAAVSTGIFGILIKSWLEHRLKAVRTAEAKAQDLREKRREGSRAVAEILSEWIRSSYTGSFTNEDRWKLQSQYWKNILDLDRSLVGLLVTRLANAPNAVTSDEIIVEARRILLNLKEPDLSPQQLNHWLPVKDGANTSEAPAHQME